jgi:hypothetical protein
MTRKQKLILGLLALVDVIVVGVIAGYIVVTTARDRRQPAAPFPAPSRRGIQASDLPACTRYLLETLTIPGQSVEVSEDAGAVWAKLTVTPQTGENVVTPQVLWLTLDLLTPEFAEACPDATTLTIAVSAASEGQNRHYVAQVRHADLIAWLRNEMNEDDFAATIRYRAVSGGP